MVRLMCYCVFHRMLLYDEIDMLLKYGVKVNAVDERTGDNVLHILAKKRSHSGKATSDLSISLPIY